MQGTGKQEVRRSRQARKRRRVDLEVKGSRKMGYWGWEAHPPQPELVTSPEHSEANR